jgi:hypothetical protein
VLAELVGFNQALIDVSPIRIDSFDGISGKCLSDNDEKAKMPGTSTVEILKLNFRKIASLKEPDFLNDAEPTLRSEKIPHKEINLTTGLGIFIMGLSRINTNSSLDHFSFILSFEPCVSLFVCVGPRPHFRKSHEDKYKTKTMP